MKTMTLVLAAFVWGGCAESKLTGTTDRGSLEKTSDAQPNVAAPPPPTETIPPENPLGNPAVALPPASPTPEVTKKYHSIDNYLGTCATFEFDIPVSSAEADLAVAIYGDALSGACPLTLTIGTLTGSILKTCTTKKTIGVSVQWVVYEVTQGFNNDEDSDDYGAAIISKRPLGEENEVCEELVSRT